MYLRDGRIDGSSVEEGYNDGGTSVPIKDGFSVAIFGPTNDGNTDKFSTDGSSVVN